jgi:uncharacterized protein (DUF1499 family)
MKKTHAKAGSADRPDKFSTCPDSPNCVSSQSADNAHFIEPLHYDFGENRRRVERLRARFEK